MVEKNNTIVGSCGVNHLFLTVFLFHFSSFMVVSAIIDVSMAAVCPGKDECSLAIYLTGVQQAIIGLGSLVMMPLIGNLSDHYGRKLLLTFPMMIAIFPAVILAYSRDKEFFYAYYVLKTLTSMVCEGAVLCLAHAYLADNVPDHRRASMFGILSGISSCSFVTGNLLTRFLPSVGSVFQVSAAVAMVSVVYMRIFLPESNMEANVIAISSKEETKDECLLEKGRINSHRPFRTTLSLHDSISLLRNSTKFSQAAIVAFFSMLGELGLLSSAMYYLKAEFHFDKDQFAELLIITGIAGIISQMILMPFLSRLINEEKLLAIGLASSCIYIFLIGIAWTSWVHTFAQLANSNITSYRPLQYVSVVYLASALQILAVFVTPSLRTIVSKQAGPTEQGKAQGCITGLNSLAGIISPLVFSPLTALFLSDHAPFHFPGFSIMCATLTVMIAFIQSILMKAGPAPSHLPVSDSKIDEYDSVEP
ncbi:major facilitator superfamily protein [Artemisia annua]|uniref:Major facilitator superfamily protein n=1 Tax=Artemisia annua TaxID=35608 RepID=A0A2U1P3A1_ARTAN|nr:major facilitator superfamily protein [Artemisia annua]